MLRSLWLMCRTQNLFKKMPQQQQQQQRVRKCPTRKGKIGRIGQRELKVWLKKQKRTWIPFDNDPHKMLMVWVRASHLHGETYRMVPTEWYSQINKRKTIITQDSIWGTEVWSQITYMEMQTSILIDNSKQIQEAESGCNNKTQMKNWMIDLSKILMKMIDHLHLNRLSGALYRLVVGNQKRIFRSMSIIVILGWEPLGLV